MDILKKFFENNEIDNIIKNKYLFFKDNDDPLNNHSNLAIRILQDIKRRDEIRELYNTHKKRELKKKNLVQNLSSSSLNNVI